MTKHELPPDAESGDDQKRKKTVYFSRFALAHLSEMRLHKEGGILGKENAEWRNISEHCLVESVGADILGEALGGDREKLVTGLLLHDWYKRREVEAMKKVGAGEGYVMTAGEDRKLLAEAGVPEDIIDLAHANSPGTADRAVLAERSLEKKIVHFMDAITSGSDFVTLAERYQKLSTNPRNIEYSESFRPRYGGISEYELNEKLGNEEQAQFEKTLNLPAGGLIDFIREKIEERINAG